MSGGQARVRDAWCEMDARQRNICHKERYRCEEGILETFLFLFLFLMFVERKEK